MSIAAGTKVRVVRDEAEFFAVGTEGVIVEPSPGARDLMEPGESVANFPDTGDQEFYVRESAESVAQQAYSIQVEVIDG